MKRKGGQKTSDPNRKFDFGTWEGQLRGVEAAYDVIFKICVALGDEQGDADLPHDAKLVGAAFRFYAKLEASCRTEYLLEQRALVVWRFIHYSRIIATELKKRVPNWKGGPLIAELPHWCIAYLANSAMNIQGLCLGHDPRTRPDDASADADWKEWWESESLTSKQRLAAAPGVLGFASQGFNAFAKEETIDFTNFLLVLVDDALPGWPKTKSGRINKLLSDLGRTDDRALRRRLSKRRTARGGPQGG